MLRTQSDVILGLELVFRLLTPDANLGILLGALADGAAVMRQIWDAKHDVPLLHVEGIGFLADMVNAFANAADFRFDGGSVFALLLGDADLLADPVAVALKLLALRLSSAAMLVDRQNLVYQRGEITPTGGEAFLKKVGFFTEEADVEHRARKLAAKCHVQSPNFDRMPTSQLCAAAPMKMMVP